MVIVARVGMWRRVNPALIHRLLLDLLCGGSHIIVRSCGSSLILLLLLLHCMLLLLNDLVFVVRVLPV